MSGAVARIWRDAGVAHIDVRGLPPPQPLIEIIRLIESGEAGEEVIVHHDREPLLLYPELDERGWTHEIIAHSPGEVLLRLARAT